MKQDEWDLRWNRLSEKETYLYAAGFLDGEGCFTVISKDYPASIRVTASNTYKPVLLWLQKVFGGSVAPQYRDNSKIKKGHRPTYIWNVDSNNAFNLITKLLPYLHEKAPQAAILLLLHQTKGPRGRNKVSEETKELRIKLYNKLKELKHVSH